MKLAVVGDIDEDFGFASTSPQFAVHLSQLQSCFDRVIVVAPSQLSGAPPESPQWRQLAWRDDSRSGFQLERHTLHHKRYRPGVSRLVSRLVDSGAAVVCTAPSVLGLSASRALANRNYPYGVLLNGFGVRPHSIPRTFARCTPWRSLESYRGAQAVLVTRSLPAMPEERPPPPAMTFFAPEHTLIGERGCAPGAESCAPPLRVLCRVGSGEVAALQLLATALGTADGGLPRLVVDVCVEAGLSESARRILQRLERTGRIKAHALLGQELDSFGAFPTKLLERALVVGLGDCPSTVAQLLGAMARSVPCLAFDGLLASQLLPRQDRVFRFARGALRQKIAEVRSNEERRRAMVTRNLALLQSYQLDVAKRQCELFCQHLLQVTRANQRRAEIRRSWSATLPALASLLPRQPLG